MAADARGQGGPAAPVPEARRSRKGAHDALQILFTRPGPDRAVLTGYLRALDESVGRYERIREKMQVEATWAQFPKPRRDEMEQGDSLVSVLRAGHHELFQ